MNGDDGEQEGTSSAKKNNLEFHGTHFEKEVVRIALDNFVGG